MPWNLRGQLIESCSCNMFCPCWYGVKDLMIMDQGWCRTAITTRIQQGTSDGVDLGGRTVVLAGDFPGPTLFDGNAKMRVYVDDGASAEQRRALESIFNGSVGGPMAVIAPLVATWLPTVSAPITVRDQGDTISVTVGNVGQVQSKLLRDDGGSKFTLRGGGLVAAMGMKEAELAPTTGSRLSDPDLPAFETKSGARGDVVWSG